MAKKPKDLKDFSYEEWEELRKTGMLWEFHPEACISYADTMRKLNGVCKPICTPQTRGKITKN